MDLSPAPASRREERGALRRAVAVLDALATDVAPPSVRSIAECTGLSKSAVQRILVELEGVDLAVRDPATRRYGLGPRTLALGSAYQRGLSLHTAAIGPMTDLAAEVRETVGLSVGHGDRLVHVEQVEPERRLSARFHVGRPLPLWFGAPARLLLAARSDDDVLRVLDDREQTDIVPVNPPGADELRRQVEEVRRTGHARAFEETIEGVHTLSVVVRGADGALAAVLSVTAPAERMDADRMDEVLPRLQDAADRISARLGHRGP
ncbi:IclR family transcriptional regulator [Nocardioides pinisoli]|uniref:IclR family transcriptional regulator n=1 Tax=Nocardioides pinisoli TaxID=2950279 RepID=A0ABT1L319_9ACTN|nr:IclR family transcriptional regulator [Nocardioides pinisoli]MCP3423984.1 IclR family transcriptional regulator [Nocardioides pinisoli]